MVMDLAALKERLPLRKLGLVLALSAICATPAAANIDATKGKSAKAVQADYTIYIGGLIVAEGSMDATLSNETYVLQSEFGSAGLPKKFWDAKWTMTSEGRVKGDELRPSRFAFQSIENEEKKERLLTYDQRGMPKLTFDPPLQPEEEKETPRPFERKGTLDPVSSLLLPVAAAGNPCDRTLPVFDGKRRYDLDLTFDRNDKITTRNEGYSGEAVVCKVRMTPRSGMDKAKLARGMRERGPTWIWLAPLKDGRFYLPVRVQMRTPIGAAVLDVVKWHPSDDRTASAQTP